jgi:hypothetical protein
VATKTKVTILLTILIAGSLGFWVGVEVTTPKAAGPEVRQIAGFRHGHAGI